MGYPTDSAWTIGLLAVANRHRRTGIATTVLTRLTRAAARASSETGSLYDRSVDVCR
jgi:hypothetical protein